MKRLLILTLFVCIGLISRAQDEKQNIIKLNPVGLLFGGAQLGYERALGEKTSVVVAPTFGFFKTGGFKYTTYGLGAELRLYLSSEKAAPTGFYVSPGAAYFGGKAEMDDFSGGKTTTKISGYSFKGVAGYQWVWDSGLSLELNGGVQYFGLKFKDSDGVWGDAVAFKGILPAVGFSVGYAF